MLQSALSAMPHVYFAGWAGLRSGPNIAVEPTPYRAKHSSIWGLCSNGTENWEVHAKHPVRRDPGEDATPPEPRTLTTRTSNVPGS
jgi:hypothetical protein